MVAVGGWMINSLVVKNIILEHALSIGQPSHDGVFADRNAEQLLNATLFKTIANPNTAH